MKEQEFNDGEGYMTYKVSIWNALGSSFLIIAAFACSIYFFTAMLQSSFGYQVFAFLFILLFGGLLAYVLNRYSVRSKQILQLSPDNDLFYFTDGATTNKYDKDDIAKITIYQPNRASNGRVHSFYVYNILFKDGSILKFSNMLISEQKVLDNFLKDLVRYDPKSPFWQL